MEYGCIGEKLRHSFSKEIHARIGAYGYDLKELAPQDVEAFLRAITLISSSFFIFTITMITCTINISIT